MMPAEEQLPREDAEGAEQPMAEERGAVETAEVGIDDVDLQPAQHDDGQEKLSLNPGSARRCWPRSRLGKGLCGLASSCCFALLVALVVGTTLLWPRKPTWELQTLDFDKEQLGGLINAFTGNSNGSVPSMSFYATVKLNNPNFVQATAEPGNFAILFNGLQMGTGISATLDVPARSDILIPVNVSVDLSSKLVKDLNQAVAANNFMLPITTVGSAEVTVLTGLHVHCQVACSVQVSVLKLLSEPARVVWEKDCDYHYELF